MAGYNVQAAVDAKHHLIVTHEITNTGHDRDQLSGMAGQAKAAIGLQALDVLADCGYFDGEECWHARASASRPMCPSRSP